VNGKFYLGLFFSMKKPVAESNFLASDCLFMVTFPIEVKPCFCVPWLWCPTVRGSGSFAKAERLRIGTVPTVATPHASTQLFIVVSHLYECDPVLELLVNNSVFFRDTS
jgi:hypothetical protein